jgi:hypothetical protein
MVSVAVSTLREESRILPRPTRLVYFLTSGRVLTTSVTFWGLGKASRRKNTLELGPKSPLAFPSPQTVI